MRTEPSVEVRGNTSWFVSVRQRPWKSASFTRCRAVGVGWVGGGVGRAASGPAPTGLKRACGVAAPCPFGPPLTPGPLRALRQASKARPVACPAARPPHPTTSPATPGTDPDRTGKGHAADRRTGCSRARTGAVTGMLTARSQARTLTVSDVERSRTRPEPDRDDNEGEARSRPRAGAVAALTVPGGGWWPS